MENKFEFDKKLFGTKALIRRKIYGTDCNKIYKKLNLINIINIKNIIEIKFFFI